MYKFQKVRLNYKGIEINYDWMLVIESLKDLIDYHENVMSVQIPYTWKNLDEVQQGKAHISTNLGMMINFQAEACERQKSLIELTAIASGKIFEAKAYGILNAGKIYINKNGGFFPHSKDITIFDELTLDSDKVIFPQYTEKDIRIKKWEGGKHFYAYVGDFQVELHGENKWNSEEIALTKAKAFLYKLRNKQFEIKE